MTLSQIRQDCQLTQHDLARLLGVGRSTVAMWETGQCKPDILMANKISKQLKVNVETIVNCFKGE